MADKYKPSEHGGKREDGQPDKRTQQSEFAYGKVDPHQAGQQGGSTTGAGGSAPGEFAHGTVDAREAGRAGGSK
ncbi:Hypothetical protein PENO1_019740 [Penicillium occitanis (nom. inval.)]|nr:hypothetical protein PENOC_091790 [Penicillium occitanis (nom. inval.)]PCH06036.1 Hypothetical protein PENO1_019740 [Penicillium occitanis (nom. inval.)]